LPQRRSARCRKKFRSVASGQDFSRREASQRRPIVLLHGEAAKIAKMLKIKELQISLTHVKSVAVASVVAVG
jgi:phosphopantetheinyl transferase (holo-ACP synthase)